MKNICFAGCFAILCFFSCKKEKTPEEPELPAPTPAPVTGQLSGKVNHFDEFGTLYTAGLNSTTVSIENQTVTGVTDGNGVYSFQGIVSGTYTLVFKKPGCGLMKLRDIHFKATDTVTYNASVADIPAFTISNAYVKDTSWYKQTPSPLPGVYYHAGVNSVNSKATVVAIIGKSASLDISNPSSYRNYATASLVNTYDFNRFTSYFLLKSYQFQKDSIMYVKIYPVAATGASYFDPDYAKPVYTAYGTPYPTTFMITMP
jgi:hypothetical protein